MSSPEPEILDDETAITEITFLPDGRLCLFGASREILELLGQLNLGDTALHERLVAIRSTEPTTSQAGTIPCHE